MKIVKNKDFNKEDQEKDIVFDEFLEDIKKDIKLEKYQLIWKKYGKLILTIVSAILTVIVVLNFWYRYDTNKKEEFALQFIKAQSVAENGKIDEAISLMSYLSSKNRRSYSVLAKMYQAGLLAKSDFEGNVEKIKEIYNSVFSDRRAPVYLRDLARILYANALLQEIKSEISPEKAKELLEILSKCKQTDNGLFLMAKELEGLVYYKIQDYKKARESFDFISKNSNTPEGMYLRVSIMIQAVQDKLDSSSTSSGGSTSSIESEITEEKANEEKIQNNKKETKPVKDKTKKVQKQKNNIKKQKRGKNE